MKTMLVKMIVKVSARVTMAVVDCGDSKAVFAIEHVLVAGYIDRNIEIYISVKIVNLF